MTLANHCCLRDSGWPIKILPTFRPDKAMAVEDAPAFRQWVEKLGGSTDISIQTFGDFMRVLRQQHEFFIKWAADCRITG